MKSIRSVSGLVLASLLGLNASATTLTVDTTADTHSVGYNSPGFPNSSGSTDGTGHTSLRSALEFASTSGGTWTINLPTGTYSLTLGDLVVGAAANTTITILGQGTPANTAINQTQAHRMVFVVNYNVDANVAFTLDNVTVSGGNEDNSDPDGFGGNGGAILAGGSASAPGNAVTLNNVVFTGNTANGNASGGAISMTGGGDLIISNCTFSNNHAGAGAGGSGAGGAVYFDAGFVAGNVSIQNSTFANNIASGGNGLGGAVYLASGNGNPFSINSCIFTGNNAATRGGAIDLESGHLTANFNRITGNTAPATKGNGLFLLSAGTGWADLRNNWWGGNSGPNGTGGDSLVTTLSASPPSSVTPLSNGQVAFAPWITLASAASPGTISGGGTTTMTASFLQNSSSQVLTAGQVAVLIGLPVTWNGTVHGGFGSQQTTIQANGQATAVFTNDGTCNDGSGNAVVDQATATAAVTVHCADLTVSQANNTSGTAALGNNWIWTIHVANLGAGAALFANGDTLLLDNLPNANVSYGSPALANVGGLTGTVTPSIDGSGNLTCTASGAVQLAGGGSLDIQVTVTPTVMGTFTNPRTGGICRVDPNGNVPETNNGNNDANVDSVLVTAVTVTITSGLTANDKFYDGTTLATLSSNNVVLAGILPGDAGNIALSTNGYTATFNNPAVGNGKTVTVSGLSLTGSGAGKYVLIQPTLVANITGAPVTITSGLTANDKLYDGTTTATLSSNNVVWAGVLAGDAGSVALSTNGYVATFANPAVGNGKTVTVSGVTLTGSAAGHYSLIQPSLAANIIGLVDLTVSLANNTSGTVAIGGRWTWTIHIANSGTGAAFFADGSTLLMDNLPTANISYGSATLANASGLSGAVTALIDGLGNLTCTANGVVQLAAGGSFDVQVTATPTAAGTFTNPRTSWICRVDPNGIIPESNKGNNDAGDSVLVTGVTVTITSGLTAMDKVFDGTTLATLSSNNVVLAGILPADAGNVALSTNGYTATFNDPAVGNGKTVTVNGLSLTGSAAGKYSLTQPTLTANITGAPVTITSGLTANDKVYDGTTTATLSSNNVVLAGILPADAGNVTLSTNGYTATFASPAVGPGQSVTVSGLTLTGSAAGNYALIQPSLAANIIGLPVTITSGLEANNKIYDGTTTATLSSNNVVLAGVLLGDAAGVALSTNGYTATFASPAVGIVQSVTVSGLTLTGSAAGNYALVQPSLTANITAAPVTIASGLEANNKIYDGTPIATLSSNNVVLAGVLAGDLSSVALSTNGYTATFANSAVGPGQSVTVSGLTLTGSAAGNYALIQPSLAANIISLQVTITSGLEADNKIYDGTSIATLSSNNVVLAGVLVGDVASVALSTNGYTATFASPAVGAGQSVTVSGLTLTGNAAGNYALLQPTLVANITAAPATITSGLEADNKIYDGTTIATLSSNNVVLAGVLLGDMAGVALSTNGYTATFAGSAVGTGQSVTVSGLTLTGSVAGNYALVQPSLTANITAAPVTITSGLEADNRIYDGTTTATLSSNNVVLAGVLVGDVASVALSTNGYTATFASPAIGAGLSVSVSGLTLAGTAASNYSLTQPSLVANITAAPVTITSGLEANNKVYDGTTTATLSSNNVVLAGVLVGDVASVALSTNGYTATFASSAVGTGLSVTVSGLTLTGSASANYVLTQPVVIASISAAPLTVTANDAVRLYGAANPVFTGTISGLQNGDDITATYTCTADPGTAPGTYPIIPTLVSPANLQTNYQVTLVNGALTIVPQAVIQAVAQTDGTIMLSWSTTAGQQYQVQYTTNLSPTDWTNLVTLTATNSTATASDSLSASAQRFYRTVWLP